MEILLVISIILSFFTTLFILPHWIKRAEKVKLVGKDMNKYKGKEIAEAGGVGVVTGFVLGVLLYIALKIFYLKSETNVIEIFAIISVIIIISFIGIIDDIFGWKIGLTKKTRILFVLFAAIPLMVINAGQSKIFIPLINSTNLGLIYPLIIVPIGVLGASIAFNFIAGYNGLEAGQGILILFSLAIISWFTGKSWLSLITLCMIASLLAFYIFNRYPAKVFPGNILTYSVGALIASIAIVGNFERVAIFIFIPYIIETILKIRGKLKKESFAKPNKDESLELKYKKIYGLEHFSIYILKKFKKKVYEKDVAYFIWTVQIFFIILAFLIFRNNIFIK